jgi:microcystin-dependent protein
MDYRRSCSVGLMQVEQPSEGQRFFQVAWYFAPPGAKLFDKEQSFSSGIWDYEHIAQPPLLGEQPPYAFPWFNGENPWGYTGQCRVGTDDQFLNGLTAADLVKPLDPIPLCCAPPRLGQTWFLRHDLKPKQDVVPGQLVGSNWDNVGAPIDANVLSDNPGFNLGGKPFTVTVPSGAQPPTGFLQFLTAPLPAQVIPSQLWLLGFTRIFGASTGSVQHTILFTMSVIDGATGLQKSQILTGLPIGGSPDLTGGVRQLIAQRVVQDANIDFGDYLCLEIGWAAIRIPAAAFTYGQEILDSGTVPVSSNPVNPSPLSLLQYPPGGGDADMPLAGTILPFAGPLIPIGYLPCDGSIRSAADFPSLYTAIGTTWGTAGVGTFALPDLRDRALIGTSPGALSPTRPSVRALADVAGEEKHTLLVQELAVHKHNYTDPGHSHAPSDGSNFICDGATTNVYRAVLPTAGNRIAATTQEFTDIVIENEGGDIPHNNMQPFAVIVWAIKT